MPLSRGGGRRLARPTTDVPRRAPQQLTAARHVRGPVV
ncbi:MAG: hypothetical protein AVDCRST_MAG48-1785 [uncultured Friedmanniella sp.]|uniref:Uncharacterized protein n=1 Tax=uncultured Friedmanniella sp. TaxID=335381 RepID=A0A6J4KK62_9ACTN|nr:MAG: hypothetical protein AVDCRST_MAG48-1785 [uncultured Friedmanniella sp.]